MYKTYLKNIKRIEKVLFFQENRIKICKKNLNLVNINLIRRT